MNKKFKVVPPGWSKAEGRARSKKSYRKKIAVSLLHLGVNMKRRAPSDDGGMFR